MMPAIARIVVVLPAPLGPSRPRICPGMTSNDRSATATVCLYVLWNPITWIKRISFLGAIVAARIISAAAHRCFRITGFQPVSDLNPHGLEARDTWAAHPSDICHWPFDIARMPKPTVLVTEGSDAKPLDWLREHANVVEINYDDPGFDAALATADGMVVRTYTKVNAA